MLTAPPKGNARVGRIVARAAAEHLTPLTLEVRHASWKLYDLIDEEPLSSEVRLDCATTRYEMGI